MSRVYYNVNDTNYFFRFFADDDSNTHVGSVVRREKETHTGSFAERHVRSNENVDT